MSILSFPRINFSGVFTHESLHLQQRRRRCRDVVQRDSDTLGANARAMTDQTSRRTCGSR